jgi:hypothetical protein
VTRSRGWWTAPNFVPAETHHRSVGKRSSIRVDLVERIRREIADGTYDTPEKWEIALDRLLNQLDP